MSDRDEPPIVADIVSDGPSGGRTVPQLAPQPGELIIDAELSDRGRRPPVVPIYEAEAVAGGTPPAARHPLRFGLKALLLLTAVCSGQFALMSYLGTLAGLLITALFCGICLAVLLVVSVFVQGETRAAWMARLDQVVIRLTLAVALLLVGALMAGGGLAMYHQVQVMRLSRSVQKHLGFTARNEMILETNDDGFAVGRDAIYVRGVTTGGAFHQAGVQQGDVIVTALTPREYYQMLQENRGRTVTLQVASGAVGNVMTPVDQCPQRTLELQIPP